MTLAELYEMRDNYEALRERCKAAEAVITSAGRTEYRIALDYWRKAQKETSHLLKP